MTDQDRNVLIMEFYPLIVREARRIASRTRANPFDLSQLAVELVLRHWHKYDPAKGKPSTYFMRFIRTRLWAWAISRDNVVPQPWCGGRCSIIVELHDNHPEHPEPPSLDISMLDKSSQALVNRIIAGETQRQIAATMGLTHQAISHRLKRIRLTIRNAAKR
jgi:DNA-directed RNA polymerase specialized sigma subunit